MSKNMDHGEPFAVKAEVGTVVVTGVDGLDVELTPEVALIAAAKLIDAATAAEGKADIEADLARGTSIEDQETKQGWRDRYRLRLWL